MQEQPATGSLLVRWQKPVTALFQLQQKYYLQEPGTGEYAGLYFWKGKADFDTYRKSELRKTIASAYKTTGKPRIEVFDVLEVLRDNTKA